MVNGAGRTQSASSGGAAAAAATTTSAAFDGAGAGGGTEQLAMDVCIGFSGRVPGGLAVHGPSQTLVYAVGNSLVLRDPNGKEQSFLHGHSNRVSCLAVSPSGRYVASGQVTHSGFLADVIVWDYATRSILHRCSMHKGKVARVAFSPNETFVLSLGGEDDNSIVLWEVATGKAVGGAAAATKDPCYTIAWPNNTEAFFVSGGRTHVRVWDVDVANRKMRARDVAMGALRRNVHCICVSNEDDIAYCGTDSGDVLIVNVQHAIYKGSGPEKTRFSLGVQSMVQQPTGDLVVGGGDGTMAVLRPGTLQVVRKTSVLGGITSLARSNVGTHFYVGTDQSNVYLVPYADLDAKLQWSCHYERVNDVVFPHAYSRLFLTASLGEIRVWNRSSGLELLRIAVPNLDCHCVIVPQDGKSILSGWSDGAVRAFTPQTGKLMYTIRDAHTRGVTSLAITPDGQLLVSGGGDGQVRLWRLGSQSQQLLASMKEHKGAVSQVQVTHDGKECLSACVDGSVIVWDVARHARSKALFENNAFRAAAYHPDESQILTTGSARKVTYWDAFDGTAIREIDGSERGEVSSLSIARDGYSFVSGGADSLVRVWTYDEGAVKFVGVGHSSAVTKVAVSPSQDHCVSVGDDGSVIVWSYPFPAS